MKILVTGGAGFVGTSVVKKLLESGCCVYVIDNFETSKMNHLPASCSCVNGTVLDNRLMKRLISEVDYVIHLAAVSYVRGARHDVGRLLETNIRGSFNIFQNAVESGVKKVIFASSISVYGQGLNHKEGDAPNPRSIYAITKLTCEHLMKALATERTKFIACRQGNVYGPYDYIVPRIIPDAVKQWITSGHAELGDLSAARDFIYVADVAEAMKLLLEVETENFGIYNVGTQVATTMHDLIKIMKDVYEGRTAKKVSYTYKPVVPSRRDVISVDSTKLRSLGWKPTPLEKGLVETIDWFTQRWAHMEDAHAVSSSN